MNTLLGLGLAHFHSSLIVEPNSSEYGMTLHSSALKFEPSFDFLLPRSSRSCFFVGYVSDVHDPNSKIPKNNNHYNFVISVCTLRLFA